VVKTLASSQFALAVRLRPGFQSNAIACVGKHPIVVATASTEHSYWQRLRLLLENFTQQTQALPIGMLVRSSGNHDWMLANAKAIAFEWKPGLSDCHLDGNNIQTV